MVENSQIRPLAEDERVLADLIIGADSLGGGNVAIANAGARLVADQYPLDSVELPPAYHDATAVKLRESEGATPALAREVREYIDQYGLLNARSRLAAAFADSDPSRKAFMDHLGQCVEEMAKLAVANVEESAPPPFEGRWKAAIGRDPELTDAAQLRDNLRAALAGVGIEVERDGDRRGALTAWEHKIGAIPKERFIPELQRELGELLALSRSKLFLEAGLDVDDVPFDGMEVSTFDKPDSHVSGSNLYVGGRRPDGSPAMKSNLELNAGHPVTRFGLKHLAAHEGMPGHYADSVLSDLMWTQGRVGFEAVTSTMCTRDVVLREGWAQNAVPALFGGAQQVIDALGPNFAVEMAVERLVDAAKNDGVILRQRDGMDEAALARQLATSHVLSDMFIRKILGWARHPLIGSMYAGAYLRGATTVEDAIEKYGVAKVAALCFHQNGYHDIDTFASALESEAA